MILVSNSGLDHVAYILILYSLAFLLFLFVNMLIHVYDRAANANGSSKKINNEQMNGHARNESRQIRDAEEFELDGLMSEDEDEEHAARKGLLKEDTDADGGLGSPGTVGRNSDRVAS